jgi:hypothetical protein
MALMEGNNDTLQKSLPLSGKKNINKMKKINDFETNWSSKKQ